MSNDEAQHRSANRPVAAVPVRKFAVPIILGWMALTLLVSFGVPSLEQVAREHAVSLGTKDAPSVKAMARIGKVFKESDSDAVAMIVIEGDNKLGDDAHHYYQDIIGRRRPTRKMRAHPGLLGVPDRGGRDNIRRQGRIVQLNLVGKQGEAHHRLRRDVRKSWTHPRAEGVRAFVTGPAPSRPTDSPAATRRS